MKGQRGHLLPLLSLLFLCCCSIPNAIANASDLLLSYDVHLLLADTAALIDVEGNKHHMNEKELGKGKYGKNAKVYASEIDQQNEGHQQEEDRSTAANFIHLNLQTSLLREMFLLKVQRGKCFFYVMNAKYVDKFDDIMRNLLLKHFGNNKVGKDEIVGEAKVCSKSETEAKYVTLANLLTISTELLKHVVVEEEENALAEKQGPMAQQKATLKKLLALPGNNVAAGRVHHEYGQVRSVLHKYLEKLRIIEKGNNSTNRLLECVLGIVECLFPKEAPTIEFIGHIIVELVQKAAKTHSHGHEAKLDFTGMAESEKKKNRALMLNNEFISWASFSAIFGRKFTNLEEIRLRHKTFESSKNVIQGHNWKMNSSFKMAFNKFADRTNEEMRSMNGYDRKKRMDYLKGIKQKKPKFLKSTQLQIADTVDWRKKGIVSPIKNQEQCGSCWVFSAIATLESRVALNSGLKGPNIQTFSEQQCMDCSTNYGSGRCDNGGWPEICYNYFADCDFEDGPHSVGAKQLMMSDEIYPYISKDAVCRKASEGVAVQDWDFVAAYFMDPPYDEGAMKQAIYRDGPVSACIDVTRQFSMYKSGVFYDPNCSEYESPDYEGGHCIEIVGYGTDKTYAPDNVTVLESNDHWLVKNSWGDDWGDEGFIKMARNRKNNCMIASDVTYPIIGTGKCS